MTVTLGMKRIQTKLAMTKTYCNSEKGGLGEDISNKSGLYPMGYDRQEYSLPNYNLFSLTSNPFYLNLTQLPKNWINFLVLRSAKAFKGF